MVAVLPLSPDIVSNARIAGEFPAKATTTKKHRTRFDNLMFNALFMKTLYLTRGRRFEYSNSWLIRAGSFVAKNRRLHAVGKGYGER